MGYFGAGETDIKNQKQEISWHCPFECVEVPCMDCGCSFKHTLPVEEKAYQSQFSPAQQLQGEHWQYYKTVARLQEFQPRNSHRADKKNSTSRRITPNFRLVLKGLFLPVLRISDILVRIRIRIQLFSSVTSKMPAKNNFFFLIWFPY